MNKTQLVAAVAEEAELTKAQAANAVNTLFNVVKKSLAKEEEVTIPGVGKFFVTHRKARKGRNPQTGQEIQIAASKSPSFKAGKELKDAVK